MLRIRIILGEIKGKEDGNQTCVMCDSVVVVIYEKRTDTLMRVGVNAAFSITNRVAVVDTVGTS